MREKITKLKKIIKPYNTLAIAFSGGTDSTLLAKITAEVLPERTLLVHIKSPLIKESETEFATQWAEKENIPFCILNIDPLNNNDVRKNDPKRCYYCKKIIMDSIFEEASKHGIKHVADGANTDDLNDYRPGIKASDQIGVIHPFIEADINKIDIRHLSKMYRLPNWDTPAAACLASRIKYGTSLSPEILEMVAEAEEFLTNLGFVGCRVRNVDNKAEIEVNPSFFRQILTCTEKITDKLKSIGFIAVMLNLEGYKQGSMNRAIKKDEKK